MYHTLISKQLEGELTGGFLNNYLYPEDALTIGHRFLSGERVNQTAEEITII